MLPLLFSQSAAIAANISNPSGPSGSGNASYSSSETATALAGRTAGVLALWDDPYAACQTYVNGIIGHDACALILSNTEIFSLLSLERARRMPLRSLRRILPARLCLCPA